MVRTFVVISLCALSAATGCDRRPDNVKAIMDGPRRAQTQAMLPELANRCRTLESTQDVFTGHALQANPSVANASISCLPPASPMPTAYSLRSETGADTSTSYFYDKDRQDFFHDHARFPSQLSSQPGMVDLCVVSGTEHQLDATMLCIAWRD